MIYILIGTKAQFIKMAPVMVVLEKESVPYLVVDLSQHGKLGREMLDSFDINPEFITPFPRDKSVDSVKEGLVWTVKILLPLLSGLASIRKRLFPRGPGEVLVHGDTMSTLVGVILARRARLPVALVEAGLRSGWFFSPFPEELIRRLVERFSRTLFVPGAREYGELITKFPDKHIVNTIYNTGRDALMLMVKNGGSADNSPLPVVTLHRLETISSKRRLESAVKIVLGVGERVGKLRFVMHPPTEKALIKHGFLQDILSSPYIICQHLQQYNVFASYLVSAPFIITDGGSIQEEASYLGKPCLILRDRTERDHGIGQTARLTSWSVDKDWEFLEKSLNVGMGNLDEESAMIASEAVVHGLSAVNRS